MRGELLTPQEVADALRVPVSWVYGHVGELPHYKIGRLLRFDRAEVAEWFAGQHRNAVKPSGLGTGEQTEAASIQ